MHVLITGAGGHLGRKLFDFLSEDDQFTVGGLDIRPVDHPDIHVADFGAAPTWARHLETVDVIVHLAGDREPTASWASSIRNNMDATLALYHHAAQQGVSRVVLASSNWLHGDKRFTDDILNSDTPPGPVNAYGMSKLFCERAGKYFADTHGLSVICMRIGWAQWTHDNKPGPHMAMGRWGQEMWLSDRDFLSGMRAAIVAKDVSFAALNLMSDNPGMRWDIEETKRTIPYVPQDGARAVVPWHIGLKGAAKKLFTQTLPLTFDRWFPSW
ncbi:NAD-dependent epimerase/dehydratase family protein [Shimia thalassica]|uniref:NAD-dependent epimerase/dehydratase family protein n=1 Tax=Shimia thalassica TaxID=1715693 RepID=UPI0026E3B742|nr:NAD(P)-dependent oxidoreductase [Shimia thalassica]MDO6800343.1 NAD(P)-dependent oxidoreductase [Shimia thalassica]